MNRVTVLGIVKQRLGISTEVRDTYLYAIIDGVVQELTDEKGLAIDLASPSHLVFVADFVVWRYQSRDSAGGMPRDLQYRLHNLMIHSRVGDTIVI